MKRLVLIWLLFIVTLGWGQTTVPTPLAPTPIDSTDLTANQLTLLSTATAGDTCNNGAGAPGANHIWCASNTTGTGPGNATALLSVITSAIGVIQAGNSTDGEVIVLGHNPNAFPNFTNSYQFNNSGVAAPFSILGNCWGNYIAPGSDLGCVWLLGPLVQPSLSSIKPLIFVTDHYGHFPDQHTRAIPVDGDGYNSPQGMTHNVLPSDYAQIVGASNANASTTLVVSQNNTNGVRFIGVEFPVWSTKIYTPGLNAAYQYFLVHTGSAGITAGRGLFIKDLTTGVSTYLHGMFRIDTGYPTIAEMHVNATTPCAKTYTPIMTTPGSTYYACFYGLNTHWKQGLSMLNVIFNGHDVSAQDATVNAMTQGAGSGQCAAGAVNSGLYTMGNVCVVDATHAYASITYSVATPYANGGIHGFYIDTPANYPLTAAGTASGGNTVYNGTFTPANFTTGQGYTVSGFTTSANNGNFAVVSVAASTITLANSGGVAETHAGQLAANGTYAAGTEASTSSEAMVFQQPQSWSIACASCPIPSPGNGMVYIPSNDTGYQIVATGTVGGANATNWTSTHGLVLGQGASPLGACTGLNAPKTGCIVPSLNVGTQVWTSSVYSLSPAGGLGLSSHSTPVIVGPNVAGGGGPGGYAGGSSSPSTGETDAIYRGIRSYLNIGGTGTFNEVLDYCGGSRYYYTYIQRGGGPYTVDCYGVGTQWGSSMNCSGTCSTSNIGLGSGITISQVNVISTTHLQITFSVSQFAETGAQHITFDRVWVHGSDGTINIYGGSTPCSGTWMDTRPTCVVSGSYDTALGIGLEGPNNAVINSYVNAIHGVNNDSQAVGSSSACSGPTLVRNNFLSASTENAFFGGGSGLDTNLGMCASADLELDHNHLYKPPVWFNLGVGYTGGQPYSGGNTYAWSEKNLFETKGINRCWVHENVMENKWHGAVRTYYAITGTPRNSSGSAADNYNDCLFENNLMTGVVNGTSFTAFDVNNGYEPAGALIEFVSQGAMPTVQSRRVFFRNNLWIINQPNEGGAANSPIGLFMTGAGTQAYKDYRFEHNTLLPSIGNLLNTTALAYGGINATPAGIGGSSCTSSGQASYNIWVRNNVMFMGEQGSSSCTPSSLYNLPSIAPNSITQRFQGNVMPQPGTGTPGTTGFPTTTFYSTITQSSNLSTGQVSVATPQAGTYPQTDQSTTYTTDYTLTGPLTAPSVANWIGPGASQTSDGLTSGINMGPITAMVPSALKGTSPVVGCTINQTSLPAAVSGEAYTTTLTITGCSASSWTVSVGSLPTGLSLNSSTGVISGTPSGPTSTFTIAYSTATQVFTLTVNPALAITTTTLPSATVSGPYSATIVATGGSGGNLWSVTSGAMTVCPTNTNGLCLNSGSGSITGTPAAATTQSFIVQVADSGGGTATSGTLSITVTTSLVVTTSSLPIGTVGIGYSANLVATGGTPAYTWSQSAGTMCAGLTLNSGGTITGTPTTAQTCSFTVQVTDSLSAVATAPLSITIGGALTITNISFSNATVGRFYSAGLGATGGTSPYSWAITAGSLPNGLSITGGGLTSSNITGIPTTGQVSSFTLQVTDSATPTPSVYAAPFTITVVNIPVTTINGGTVKRGVIKP